MTENGNNMALLVRGHEVVEVSRAIQNDYIGVESKYTPRRLVSTWCWARGILYFRPRLWGPSPFCSHWQHQQFDHLFCWVFCFDVTDVKSWCVGVGSNPRNVNYP